MKTARSKLIKKFERSPRIRLRIRRNARAGSQAWSNWLVVRMTASILQLRGNKALTHIKSMYHDQPHPADTGLDRDSLWKVAGIGLAGLAQGERQHSNSGKRRQAANLACLIAAEHCPVLANGDQIDLLLDAGGSLELVHHHADGRSPTHKSLGEPMDALPQGN